MTRTLRTIRYPAMLCGIALFATAATSQIQVLYRVTDVNPPNVRGNLFPPDIDNRGRVTGFSADSPGDSAGFLRTRRGSFVDLQLLPGATAVGVSGFGLNGRVVGASGTDIDTTMQAVTWNGRGRVRLLGTMPGDTFALATDADFLGRVIGGSGTRINVDTVPFLWQHGTFHALPNPAPFGEAVAFDLFGSIAANGWTTGLFGPGADPEGYVIDRHGNVQPIGLLQGGTFSRLMDMSLFGTAVGSADDGSGVENAILYRRGQLTALAPLPGDFAASLNGVNLWGTAVGQSFGPMGPRAVITRFGGDLEDLNTQLDPATPPSVLVFSASGINALGEIVAGAVDFAAMPPMPSFVLLTPHVP